MNKPTYILGISAFYHDSAACLVCDGHIVAAAQEERFSRIKHDAAFPQQAITYCLREAGISSQDITHVAFYEKPFLKFERLLLTYLSYAPSGLLSFLKAMPVWLKEKIFIKSMLQEELRFNGDIFFPEHHQSHAASAFFPSPFDRSAIITLDGVGEWTTTSTGTGNGNTLTLQEEILFPHSLGLLYSAFTYYTGFKVNSGEYKLMGLAPYGSPKYADLIRRELIDIKADGSFRLNMAYFNYPVGLTMTNARFNRLFKMPPRRPESAITQEYKDIAASIQLVTEEIMLKIACHVRQETGEENLCLAGGVALNCVGNGKILREAGYKRIWVQPAAGDAGGALGAALFAWHQCLNGPRRADGLHDAQSASLLGPDITDDIASLAQANGWVYEVLPHKGKEERLAALLSAGHIIALAQGRMEFGPRALGNRSIVADPRNASMQSTLNLKVKFRESFRPFAPAVLKEKAKDFFDLNAESPYMLLTARVNRDKINALPATTHVDASARVQTVAKEHNPAFYRLIETFEAQTGCPVLINTSFNIRGEPIVCTAQDAYRCFMCTDIDYLVINNYLFKRSAQPHQQRYKKEHISTVLD